MGWTSGWESYQSLKYHLLSDKLNNVLAHKSTKYGMHLYVAFEQKESKKTFIVLFKIQRFKDGTWGYKDIEESMGPCEIDCPLELIKMTESSYDPSKYGDEWRQRVINYWNRRKSLSKIEIGETVKCGNEEFIITRKIKKTFIGRKKDSSYEYRLPRESLERISH